MKRYLIGAIGLVALIIVVALVVPFFLPKDAIKREVVAQVEAATGWRLRIDGAVGISLLPTFSLSARDVGLAGELGADGIEFAKVAEIDFGVSLAALIGGQARITGITLRKPQVLLEIDEWGNTSWEPRRSITQLIDRSLAQISQNEQNLPPLPQADERPAIPGAENAESGPATGGPATEGQATEGQAGGGNAETIALLRRLRLDALTFEDGSLRFSDKRSGRSVALSAIDATASMPAADEAASLDGTLQWQGRAVEFSARVGSPLALAMAQASDVEAHVATAGAKLHLTGTVAAEPLSGSFRIDADGASLADTLSAFAIDAGAAGTIGAYSLAANADVTSTLVTLDNVEGTLGEGHLTGRAVLDLAAARPSLGARFAVDRIDIAALRASTGATPAVSGDGTPGDDATGDDVQHAVPAGAQPSPIDLSPLTLIDADIRLAVGELAGAGVAAKDLKLAATLANGVLSLQLDRAAAFGGSGAFAVKLSSHAGKAAVSGSVSADNVQLAQIATLAGRPEKAAGALSGKLSFTGEGKTISALVAGLQAQGSLSLSQGALDGLPLGEVAGGDPRAGRLDDINIAMTFAGLDKPVSAKGAMTWRGERFTLAASASPSAARPGKAMPVKASLTGSRVTLGAQGGVDLAGGGFDGRLSIKTADLRALLGWIGHPIGAGAGLRKFEVAGRFSLAPNRLALRDTTLLVDDSAGSGRGEIDFAGPRPKLSAKLDFDRLVLDPYLGGDGDGVPAHGNASSGSETADAGMSGWSRDTIDFSGLRAADADLDISAKTIRWDKLNIARTRLKVSLKQGTLRADLDPMNLYDGGASGHVMLDGSAAVPRIAAKFNLSGLDAHPFLTDLAGFRALHGTAAMAIDVTAAGASQADLASALKGTASLRFTDGSIRGINIAQMLRGLSVSTLLGWNSSEGQSTDFSELSASFAIDKGIALNKDLKLVGPLVRVSGGGTTDIPQRTLDWKVEPRVVASLDNTQSDDLVGLGVPVIIEGSWDKPLIYPDIAGVLENPAEAYKTLQSLGGGLSKAFREEPAETVKKAVESLSGGAIDVRKVLSGEANDDAVLKSIEEGFNLPPGLFGLDRKKKKK